MTQIKNISKLLVSCKKTQIFYIGSNNKYHIGCRVTELLLRIAQWINQNMVFALLTLGCAVMVVYTLTGRQTMSGTHSRIGNNTFQNRLLPEQTRP